MTPSERFWSRVRKSEGCWEWQGARMARGYGKVGVGGKVLLAHRYAYTLLHGPIPTGTLVRHACDNPPCVRPDHLQLGSQGDNMAEASVRGRTARGERHGRHKLTLEDVRHIRDFRAKGVGLRDIAALFSISQASVSLIARGLKWPEAGGPITEKDKRWAS